MAYFREIALFAGVVAVLTPVMVMGIGAVQADKSAIFVAEDDPASATEDKAGLEVIYESPPMDPADYGDYNASADGQITKAFASGSLVQSYQLYIPSSIDPAARGAILLLHGSQRDGATMADNWRAQAVAHDYILIAPDAPDGQWRLSGAEMRDLVAIVDDVQKEYGFDPARLHIFGHSRGGILTLAMLDSYPDMFAAAGLHAAARPKGMNAFFSSGRAAPVIFIHGTKDDVFPLAAARQSAQSYADAGHDTRLVVLDGHTHWYYTISDTINDMAAGFFENYVLPE